MQKRSQKGLWQRPVIQRQKFDFIIRTSSNLNWCFQFTSRFSSHERDKLEISFNLLRLAWAFWYKWLQEDVVPYNLGQDLEAIKSIKMVFMTVS